MIVYAIFMNRRMRRAFRENRVKIADINTQIEDNLSGIRVVKSFANEEIENGKFKQGNDAFLRAKKNSYFYMGLFHSGMSSFNILINVIVIVVGGVLLIKNLVDVPDFVAFLLYINVFTEPIQTLVEFTEQFQNGYTGFERFREIMDIEPDIEDSPDAVELKDVKGDIAFEDVVLTAALCFAYRHILLKGIAAGGERKVHICFQLLPEDSAQKSTICRLLRLSVFF